MVQEIAVLVIVLGAVGYTAYNVYQIFNTKRISSGKCAGCSSDSCKISNMYQPSKK